MDRNYSKIETLIGDYLLKRKGIAVHHIDNLDSIFPSDKKTEFKSHGLGSFSPVINAYRTLLEEMNEGTFKSVVIREITANNEIASITCDLYK